MCGKSDRRWGRERERERKIEIEIEREREREREREKRERKVKERDNEMGCVERGWGERASCSNVCMCVCGWVFACVRSFPKVIYVKFRSATSVSSRNRWF